MVTKKDLEKRLRDLDQKTIQNAITHTALLEKHKREQKKSTDDFWKIQKKKTALMKKIRKLV